MTFRQCEKELKKLVKIMQLTKYKIASIINDEDNDIMAFAGECFHEEPVARTIKLLTGEEFYKYFHDAYMNLELHNCFHYGPKKLCAEFFEQYDKLAKEELQSLIDNRTKEIENLKQELKNREEQLKQLDSTTKVKKTKKKGA